MRKEKQTIKISPVNLEQCQCGEGSYHIADDCAARPCDECIAFVAKTVYDGQRLCYFCAHVSEAHGGNVEDCACSDAVIFP